MNGREMWLDLLRGLFGRFNQWVESILVRFELRGTMLNISVVSQAGMPEE